VERWLGMQEGVIKSFGRRRLHHGSDPLSPLRQVHQHVGLVDDNVAHGVDNITVSFVHNILVMQILEIEREKKVKHSIHDISVSFVRI
jgi:hypothetical protein